MLGSDVSQGGTSDGYVLAAFETTIGATVIQFTRQLYTGDYKTDFNITNSSQFLLWAYCNQDGFGTQYTQHVVQGVASVQFFADGSGGDGTSGPSGPSNATAIALNAILASPPKFTATTGNLKVWWTLNTTSSIATITMAGNTLGWVGIGFSNVPLIALSDMTVWWSGTVVSLLAGRMGERYGPERCMP
jgi:hypothetical protein